MIEKKIKPPLSDLIDSNFEEMVNAIAWRYTRRYGNTSSLINQSDLYGEGILAAVRAYESFDPNKNTSFRTYAFISITRSIRTYCNKFRFTLSSSGRDFHNNYIKVQEANSGVVNIDDIDIPCCETPQSSLDLEEFFLGDLDPNDRQILIDKYINNLKIRELATKYRLTASGVQYRLSKIKSKLDIKNKHYENSIQ